MADPVQLEPPQSAAGAAPASSAAPELPLAPASASPAPIEAAPAPAVITPAAPAAVADKPAGDVAAAAAPKADEPKLEPTLLEKFDAEQAQKVKDAEAAKAVKPAEAKPGDKPAEKVAETKPGEKPADAAAKPAEDKKPGEEAKPAEPALAPIEYKYTLPDTIKMDDALKGRVHTALDEFRADPALGAQKLIDLHAETMQQYAEQTRRDQFDVFNKTKSAWETQVMADGEIGGAGHNTAMTAIARARDATVSSAKQGTPRYAAEMKEFNEFLAVTGAGSHRAFNRLMHNVARYVDEPQAETSALTELKPPKNNGRAPGSKLYDHASSQKMSRS